MPRAIDVAELWVIERDGFVIDGDFGSVLCFPVREQAQKIAEFLQRNSGGTTNYNAVRIFPKGEEK